VEVLGTLANNSTAPPILFLAHQYVKETLGRLVLSDKFFMSVSNSSAIISSIIFYKL